MTFNLFTWFYILYFSSEEGILAFLNVFLQRSKDVFQIHLSVCVSLFLGGNSEGPLKNRSAFCSDKLDEYLENEGKLMETNMGFSSNAPTSPVVYQLPTKSTSYVRTLDSVLKKQSTVSPSTSYSLKPHSVPPASRKAKSQNKQATFTGRTKSSYKSILPYPVSPKQKHIIPGDKVTKNSSGTVSENPVNSFVVPTLDENTFPKQINLRHAHHQQQQQQGTRPAGLSKSQVKLMDLEDCALWEGKPRTYITEERADVSLTTLLTAQVSYLLFSRGIFLARKNQINEGEGEWVFLQETWAFSYFSDN